MNQSFQIKGGKLLRRASTPTPPATPSAPPLSPRSFNENNLEGMEELKIPSLENMLACDVPDNQFEDYMSATANQQSCVEFPGEWNYEDYSGNVDEIDDSSMFSNKIETQFIQVLDEQEKQYKKEQINNFPCFHQFNNVASNHVINPVFNDYNKAFFHASNVLDPVDENTSFYREMLRQKKQNIFDPHYHVHYSLCQEWIQRNEIGLRNIYFSTLPRDEAITVQMATPLFTRYHGRDSIIMRMDCLEWPLYFTDPTGIKTFKDCIRPPWLLDYIYTVMLSTINKEEVKENNVMESPHLWTNLPVALLHPVELETEEGNYFPVTPKEFADWLTSNNF